ncbi:hypothetical protein DICVIV_03470 [Dictyocaulus viviparus]|uniref:Reelin domain-containing protein n=1 Tax=Dictyocaulus viviparus TaxID=29172 RepID=A0A0D8Y121_DICVI|nr:hypothetical protein DICVIV_03470 [Dictyocaulus viviparus]
MLSITWIIVGFFVITIDKVKGQLLEMSGFHCKQQNSMLLDHSLHGSPHLTTPPFEFYVIDEDGNEVNMYEPGKIYRSSLRGGRFIIEDKGDVFGVRYQDCDDSQSNNSLTHSNNAKKFLLEIGWTTDHDIGAVQFLLTVAVENELYWERWRPRNGFLRSSSVPQVPIIESLFEIQVPPGPEEPTLSPDEMASTLPPEELTTVEPFDSRILEEIEKAEEKAVKHVGAFIIYQFLIKSQRISR